MKMRFVNIAVTALVVFAVCVSALPAWAGLRTETKRERALREKPRPARAGYEEVLRLFLSAHYAEAEQEAARALSSGASQADEIRYFQGLSLSKLGRFAEARSAFGAVERSGAPQELKARAAVGFADAFFFEKNFPAALSAYKSALERYPRSDEAPYFSDQIEKVSGLVHTPDPVIQNVPVEYRVQIGVFSEPRNAKVLAKKVASAGYASFVETEGTRVRVFAGKCARREDAEALAERLKKDGYPTTIRS